MDILFSNGYKAIPEINLWSYIFVIP